MKNSPIQFKAGGTTHRPTAIPPHAKAAPFRLAPWVRTAGALLVLAMGVMAQAASPTEPKKGGEQLVRSDRVFTYDTLITERAHPKLSPLLEQWRQLGETVSFVETVRGPGRPLRLAVHEWGSGTNDTVVIFVHGLFGDHSNWRYLAGALGTSYDYWVIDLPGCGLSDGSNSRAQEAEVYSPSAMSERVWQAIQNRLAARQTPPRLLLAGHSLGGMVALRMMSDPELTARYAASLKQVDKLVLYAPSDVAVQQGTEAWKVILGLNGFKASVGQALGVIREPVARSLSGGFCDSSRATRELADGGVRGLVNGKSRKSAQAMMRQAITWKEFGKKLDWDKVHALEETYQNITVPCLIVWGDCDETLPLAMGYKLKDQIPNARLAIVRDSKHLLPMESPVVCAQLCQSFVQDLRQSIAGSGAAYFATLAQAVLNHAGGSIELSAPHSVTVVQGKSASKSTELARQP